MGAAPLEAGAKGVIHGLASRAGAKVWEPGRSRRLQQLPPPCPSTEALHGTRPEQHQAAEGTAGACPGKCTPPVRDSEVPKGDARGIARGTCNHGKPHVGFQNPIILPLSLASHSDHLGAEIRGMGDRQGLLLFHSGPFLLHCFHFPNKEIYAFLFFSP